MDLLMFALFGLMLAALPFVLPVVTWVSSRRLRERLNELELALQQQDHTIDALQTQIAQLRREVREPAAATVPSGAREPAPAHAEQPSPVPKPPAPLPAPPAPAVSPGATVPSPPPAPPTPATVVPPSVAAAPAQPSVARPVVPVPEPPTPPEPRRGAEPPRPPEPPEPPELEPPSPGWFDGFDWERLVGVKLFSAGAAVALALAAIYFLGYSIQHGWLQPPVRVLIGIVVAIGLLVACEMKAARKYPVTANALDAAAIAILFATFFAAHALWRLIPASAAFGLLALVTALAVLLSIRRESLFIAVLGLLGGFSTPILLSTGENRPIPLFSYLLLLNVGLAWVAYKKTWPVLTVLTLILTTLYQWGWVFRFLRDASDVSLAMAIFIVFPLVGFAGLAVSRRPAGPDADSAADATFENTALAAAIVPVIFGVYLAAVPAYGARATLLFGFLLLVDAGLLAIAIARRQPVLHSVAALSTLVVMGVWLAVSYVSDARIVALIFTSLFVVLYLGAPLIAAWFARPFDEGTGSEYAAPLLLFVFAVLAAIEPAFVAPWPLFGTLLVLTLLCAWRAAASGTGFLYYIAAFFAIAIQAIWAVQHLTLERLATAVTIFAVFGVASIAVPVAARRAQRPLLPAGGAGLVLFASLFLLLYLSSGRIAPAALWALALLLAILNAGLFVESAGARLPALSIAGSAMSWVVLAIWWMNAAGSVGVLSSLSVLVGLTLIMLAGHAWGHRGNREATDAPLFSAGLFLGLGGHLFLCALALNREWSLPPWPVFGALGVITLATSAAALYGRAPLLHAAGVFATAAVVAAWTLVATPAPWPLVALLAAAVAAGYALSFIPVFRRAGDLEIAPAGAAAALLVGEVTAVLAAVSPSRPHVAALVAAHVANLSVLLALSWMRQWRHFAVVVSIVAAVAAFSFTGPWRDHFVLSAALYLVFVAFPLVLGRRVGADRAPFFAAIIASATFFLVGRTTLRAGGYEAVIGALPVVEALALAVLLRQLLRLEAPGARDLGRLALVAGAALAFVTVAIPLQLDHQWITIGWALEGVALAWLFTRIPHRGLLYTAVALLGVVFVRLALNPEVFRYEPRGEWRILNWYLYAYLVAAAAMFAGARWLSRTDDRLFDSPIRPSRLLPAAAVILLFLLLNIEIADFYATGPEITFRFGVRVSQDLTYTIGWLVFGIVLLAAGIYARSRPARGAAVTLIAVTAFKCFLYDLREFGGLYRVGSLVGLAIALAFVSLALQKYVLAKPKEAQ